MPQYFHFEPSARLQKFLGSQLIADPNLAVAEFVKNSYDAGATQVYISFTSKGHASLTVSDNGTGMSRDSFEENWMHPGFSYKAADSPVAAPRTSSPAWAIRNRRIPIGEKGLGRFAAGRLGDILDVYTRETAEEPWLHVHFDWTAFDDMAKLLAEVEVEYDFRSSPSEERFSSGTVIEIRGLTYDWGAQVRGRKVPWRPSWRLGRLRQDLSILVGPLPTASDFEVSLASDSQHLQQFLGPLKAGEPESGDYEYRFSMSETESEIVVERLLRRSADVVARLSVDGTSGGVDVETPSVMRESREGPGATDERPRTLRCGEFSGVFIYSPLTGKRSLALGRPPGVFLYRDGMRIDPYGHGDDDWLGARAEKAKRQGYAAIQPNLLYGSVEISRADNPGLVDMSNRQGLVENDEYEDFIAHTRAEFREFARLVFEEWVKPSWRLPEARRQRQAERAQSFGVALVDALLHSIRQPIAGLGAEMAVLRRVLANDALPSAVREELREMERQIGSHLETIDRTIDRFLSLDREHIVEVEAVEVNEAVREAIGQVAPLARSFDVEVRFDSGPTQSVILPRYALVEAVSELLRNGVQVDRPSDRRPKWVRVETRKEDGVYRVIVEDNGSGMDEAVRGELGRKPVSTKGRPGVGLILVRELLALFMASYRFLKSDSEGSAIEIAIPLRQLREESV